MNDRVHKCTFFRRCHVCGAVTERESKIDRCGLCGKSVAPFYYFDDKSVPIMSDCHERPPLMAGEYAPVIGITAYW